MVEPFGAIPASTVNIDVSSSSQRVAISGEETEIRIMNDGTATVWLNFGDSTVTASVSSGFPVGAGVVEVLSTKKMNVNRSGMNIAAIAAGSTGKIYFTRGVGI